ncbi:MAG: RNA polymerase sigma factor [Bacteroidaceae bacterium]|nr:RNA polymerase sigma factor [Bacteroidaceae bacterium]
MNREQFTELMQRELPRLRKFLLAACGGSRDEADDVAQEALLKAYTAAVHEGGFREGTNFPAWLFRIAYNCLLSRQRQWKRRETTDMDALHDVAATDRSDDAFRYQHLYRAIEDLTMAERTAVLLFYMEGRPIREIAQLTGAREGTVKSLLSRGREHLRRKLKIES